jgi:hypothetical protein
VNVALPQPEPGEQLPTGGATPPGLSPADPSPADVSSDAVWFTACAWCRRIKLGGRWTETGRALELIHSSADRELRLTHGICPSCFQKVTGCANRERRFGSAAGNDAA